MNWTNIPFVATALSIVICWALFAMLCSFINEGVAQAKAERGRFLKMYLLQQLKDLPNGVNWATLLYMHGAVDLLSRAPEKPTAEISPSLFAQTIVEVVGKSQVAQMARVQAGAAPLYKNMTLSDFKTAIHSLRHSDVMEYFKQALNDAEIKSAASADSDREAAIYNQLLSNLEKWYDELMGRVSLWYKKQVRQRLLMLGILLGVLLNIDSIQLFQFFNQSSTARDVVTNFYLQQPAALSNTANRLQQANDAGQTPGLRDSTIAFALQLDSLSKAAELPIGWGNRFQKNKSDGFWARIGSDMEYTLGIVTDCGDWWCNVWKSTLHILVKILGILITGFVASMGAPFWFEILRKAYSTRK